MVVYEYFFSHTLDRKFGLNYKQNLLDNHYKSICGPVRCEFFPCRVLQFYKRPAALANDMQLPRKNRVCPKHFAVWHKIEAVKETTRCPSETTNSNLVRWPFTDWSVNRKEVDWFNWMATSVNEAETLTGVLGRILFWYFGSCPLMLRRTSPEKEKSNYSLCFWFRNSIMYVWYIDC